MGNTSIISNDPVNSYFDDKNFYLLGSITEQTEKGFYEFLQKHFESEMDKMPDKRKHIKIHISSSGGFVQDALAMVGMIEYYKAKGFIVETHIRSMAASAATLISISGTEGYRYINPYGTIMIHQLSGGTFGELKHMDTRMKFSKHQWKIMKNLYMKNTQITEEKLNEIYGQIKDWYINPEYAKRLHIVDHII